MYRMRLREHLLAVCEAVIELRAALCDIADRHRETLIAAHTHTQPAQPTTLNAASARPHISCSFASGMPLGQKYFVSSEKYLLW